MTNSDDSPQDINTRNANTCDTNDSDPENPHSDDPDSDPDSDPESDESISLAENVKYKNKRRCRNAKKTKDRHGELGREKASKPAILSQHEKLSVAIIDYVKLLLGITRKPRGAKITSVSSLPVPPSEEEIETWVQRKHHARQITDQAASKALSRYTKKYPDATPRTLELVEKDAIEEAQSKLKPVQFQSLVSNKKPGGRYSSDVAHSCEAALAHAGFTRLTFDWNSSFKSRWNEAVSRIILQEWQKTYLCGDADDYLINAHQVTAHNKNLILERWFENKKLKYTSNQEPDDDIEKLNRIAELKREKASQRNSRNNVSILFHLS
jgi:hypothetical protein